MMSDNTRNWASFLDMLDNEIKQANLDMDHGVPFNKALTDPWSPPQGLAVLPVELLDRAQALNEALNTLQVRAEAGQEILKVEIKRVQSLRTKTVSGKTQYGQETIARYVDRSV